MPPIDEGHEEHARVNLPRLSDEAVIALHDFIHHLLDRFYEALYEDSNDDALDVGIDWPL